jgi:hypothetical protein
MGKRMKNKLNESTTLSGTINLYHFTKTDMGNETILDPKETTSRRSTYSGNEYKLSNFPRVFYYTDLSKVEHQIKSSSRELYTTSVDGSKILYIQAALEEYKKDKEQLQKTDKKAYNVVHALLGGGYTDWDAMFKAASQNYLGVFYDKGGLPIVNIFTPLKVKKYVNV